MEAKEKAKELYFKMMEHSFGGDGEQSKQCSLVAVEEIISDYKSYRIKYWVTLDQALEMVNYWQQVKDEIEKL